jgi:hypothetical protein
MMACIVAACADESEAHGMFHSMLPAGKKLVERFMSTIRRNAPAPPPIPADYFLGVSKVT